MIGIIRSIMEMRCDICGGTIEKRSFKVKDSQDNSNRKYYHLACVPMNILQTQLGLWNQALAEKIRR